MKRLSLALLVVALASPLTGGEMKRFEKTLSWKPDSQKIDIKVDKNVTIESVRVRHWPDADDFDKAQKELNDKHTVWIEFTYSNRDLEKNYKCRYDVTVEGPDGMLGHDDRNATLDKGKVGDTNKLMFKMRTNDYKKAKSMKCVFEVARKD